jgi:hypothetical protein
LNVSYDIVSDETPTREGLCVYCGTPRPVAKPVCPRCGRTWIDTKVGEEIPALTPEVVAASSMDRETTAKERSDAELASRSRRPRGLLIGGAIAVVAMGAILVSVLDRDEDDTAASPTVTTTAAADTTSAETTTTPATTTTPTTAATTTSSSTTTTTAAATTTTLAPIEAVGTPIPIEDLTLGAFTLGPFSLNADTAYLGRLVATLGQPDARTTVGTEYGLCTGDEGVAYTWGALTGVFRVDPDQETLVGYRLDDTGSDHPTQTIATRSGLQLGHTVAKLDAIYLQSGLALEDIGGAPHFMLLRSTDDATLLWGPVTSIDQSGTVAGIYSPQSCDGGPRPSA